VAEWMCWWKLTRRRGGAREGLDCWVFGGMDGVGWLAGWMDSLMVMEVLGQVMNWAYAGLAGSPELNGGGPAAAAG
jgi:hypothetical protein